VPNWENALCKLTLFLLCLLIEGFLFRFFGNANTVDRVEI